MCLGLYWAVSMVHSDKLDLVWIKLSYGVTSRYRMCGKRA